MAHKQQSGMVLLEALLALALFSLIAIALLNVSGAAVNQQQILKETRCADWLAQNLLTEALWLNSNTVMGEQHGRSSQCGIDWQWTIERHPAADQRFYTLSLDIRHADGRQQLKRTLSRVR